MNPIHVVVYASSASQLISPVQLESILLQARKKNATNGITGLLLYEGGNFLQILEGHKHPLEATYNRIKQDSRHKGLITLLSRQIPARNFGNWSMAYTRVTEKKMEAALPGYNAMLERDPSCPLILNLGINHTIRDLLFSFRKIVT